MIIVFGTRNRTWLPVRLATILVSLSLVFTVVAAPPASALGDGGPIVDRRLPPSNAATGIPLPVGTTGSATRELASLGAQAGPRFGPTGSSPGPGTQERRGVALQALALLSGTAIKVSPGGGHTCALLSGGSVACWGGNWSGQLGDGSTTFSPLPVAVSGITTATGIAAGRDHTCALLSGGTVWCWGKNQYGQHRKRDDRRQYAPDIRGRNLDRG